MPSGAATQKGLEYLCEYIAAARDAIGKETPLAADHFGNLTVKDAIRYGRAFEPYNLAWAEDFIPQCWLSWRGLKEIRENTTTPVLTGEQAFGLEEGFRDLIDNHAVDLIHPDYVASGGMREIKRIHDALHVLGDAIDHYEEVIGDEIPDKMPMPLKVHRREGEPCPRCGTTIEAVFFSEHQMNYCPEEQTEGRVLKDRRLSRLLK